MFDCEQCGKRYLSQYALNRHMQNHIKDKQYTCNICDVTYSRRDLLARHEKIHQDASSDRPRTSTADDSAIASSSPQTTRRRRRHTACIHCAERRKKCSGGDPCVACVRSGQPCTFPSARARISRTAARRPSSLSESSADGDSPQMDVGALYPPSPQYSRVSAKATPPPAQLLEPTPVDQVSLYTTDPSTDTFASDLYELDSWVWLHESLYLPSNDQAVVDADTVAPRFEPAVDPPVPPTAPQIELSHSNALSGPTPSRSSTETTNKARGFHGDVAPGDRQHSIDEIVAYATMLNLPVPTKTDHGDYWRSVSDKIRATFAITLSYPQHLLQCFIDLYLRHFWPLWPVLAQHNLSVNQLHPILYLVLVSIGAMYGDSGSVQFGRLLHNKIRTYLTVAFELDDSDSDFTWLAQARLYTQIAALYFGQPKAFTYAQHLGALLVAQSRRIELFSAEQCERAHQSFMSLRNAGQSSKRLDIWLQLEARRRLAFGIFRVDTYTSILMDTRPLLSLDEINMSFPYCDVVWRATKMPVDTCLSMIDHDRTPSRHLRASDIYNIALDPDENLPTLDPIAHELLLFGLQRSLGRFAYDHSALERLFGSRIPVPSHCSHPELASPVSRSIPRESDQLSITDRRMHRLKQEFESMLQAQKKWEEALPIVKTFVIEPPDRSSLMSGLVLFHLGYLRLHAPISKLHQLQYRLTENWAIDPTLLAAIIKWTATPDAGLAAQRSCDLYGLVASEAFDEDLDRVKFNLLAFIALHHAVVILWSYAAVCDGGVEVIGPDGDPHALMTTVTRLRFHRGADHAPVEVRRTSLEAIVNAFVDLFHRISPGDWSSFAEAAAPLARLGFPSR